MRFAFTILLCVFAATGCCKVGTDQQAARSLAEKYCSAWSGENSEEVLTCFLPSKRTDIEGEIPLPSGRELSHMVDAIGPVEGGYAAQVRYVNHTDNRHGLAGSIYMVQLGGQWWVKYDFFLEHHPAIAVPSGILTLFAVPKVGIRWLENATGMTLGFDAEAPIEEQHKGIQKWVDWWRENRASFDRDDPKVFLSREDLRMISDWFENELSRLKKNGNWGHVSTQPSL
ncbi:hypothetical protein ACFLQR_03945 [Verrucomicrobiota bacterium]